MTTQFQALWWDSILETLSPFFLFLLFSFFLQDNQKELDLGIVVKLLLLTTA